MAKLILTPWEKICVRDSLHFNRKEILKLVKAQEREVKKAPTLANIISLAELEATLLTIDRLLPVFVVEPSEGYDSEAGRRYEVINESYEYSAKKFNEEVKK